MKNTDEFVRATAAFIQDDKGQVLTILRKSGTYAGFRSLPHGMVEEGVDKTLEESVLREVQEETGLQAKVVRKLTEVPCELDHTSKRNPNRKLVIYIFECKKIGGELRSDYNPEWISVDELTKMDIVPALRQAIVIKTKENK